MVSLLIVSIIPQSFFIYYSFSRKGKVKKGDNIHMLIQLIKVLALLGDGFLQFAESIE